MAASMVAQRRVVARAEITQKAPDAVPPEKREASIPRRRPTLTSTGS
jgi:hypothetical protein